jgi:molybdenum cofactor biosynthesis enzyme MoaA
MALANLAIETDKIQPSFTASHLLRDKLLREKFAVRKQYPEQFDIMVTVGCNAKCAFCVQEATFKPTAAEDEIFLSSLYRHLSDFYYQGGRKVVITGGEPLLLLPRVLATLRVLTIFPDLQVKALYTNGEKLLHTWADSFTIAQMLQLAGLGCVNLSVHHDDHELNCRIFNLPHKPSTETIAAHLRTCKLPFRLNLTLQRGGIESFEDLHRFIQWGFQLSAQDIYVRELFKFSFQQPLSQTDRDPVTYCDRHRVSSQEMAVQMQQHPEFKFLGQQKQQHLEQAEYTFLHLPSQRRVYLSHLSVGTEERNNIPYLVLMPNGNLYKGWLGEQDQILD